MENIIIRITQLFSTYNLWMDLCKLEAIYFENTRLLPKGEIQKTLEQPYTLFQQEPLP